MSDLIHLETIADLHKLFHLGKNSHSLITVVDFRQVTEEVQENTRITTDFYSIMYKNYCKNQIKYGRKPIDFQEGNLICIAPNQIIEMDREIEERDDKMGWGLFFHPDLIRSSSLTEKMKSYGFFEYEVSEALHLSEKEKRILLECVEKIQTELQENTDVHSQQIIVSNIELLLNYCLRFYGRQLITRSHSNQSIVSKIDALLNRYFSDETSCEQGIPSVKYLADHVHLSPSYLGDLLKKETGKNAQEHIHLHVIEHANWMLIHSEKNVNEIAHCLGFEYPQYFNKLFKKKTRQTPLEYRYLN